MGFYSEDAYKSSVDDTWTTPKDLYNKLNDEFNFGLDAAAMKSSTLVIDNWYGPDHDDITRRDAFTRNWTNDAVGKSIWLNPPYGRSIKTWTSKSVQENRGGGTVVLLVPARTDTTWWHDHLIQHEIRFIKGRLKFGNQKNPAPFPSAIVVMKGI
jgi:phage N-6-adenine-methyltransferase